jgi:hypothetical protein
MAMTSDLGKMMDDILEKSVLEGLWLSREQACMIAIVDAYFKSALVAGQPSVPNDDGLTLA